MTASDCTRCTLSHVPQIYVTGTPRSDVIGHPSLSPGGCIILAQHIMTLLQESINHRRHPPPSLKSPDLLSNTPPSQSDLKSILLDIPWAPIPLRRRMDETRKWRLCRLDLSHSSNKDHKSPEPSAMIQETSRNVSAILFLPLAPLKRSVLGCQCGRPMLQTPFFNRDRIRRTRRKLSRILTVATLSNGDAF
ncbi:hypothetical protein TNCV_3581941 [Trichonephila clavipes]|nr:hypothetical protein TNCV_3581941 [Trichonephila clavipes]